MFVPPKEVTPVPPLPAANAEDRVKLPLALRDRAVCDDVANVEGDAVAR